MCYLSSSSSVDLISVKIQHFNKVIFSKKFDIVVLNLKSG